MQKEKYQTGGVYEKTTYIGAKFSKLLSFDVKGGEWRFFVEGGGREDIFQEYNAGVGGVYGG